MHLIAKAHEQRVNKNQEQDMGCATNAEHQTSSAHLTQQSTRRDMQDDMLTTRILSLLLPAHASVTNGTESKQYMCSVAGPGKHTSISLYA